VAFAAACAVLTAAAAILPLWIERVSGFEPDGGSGVLEWLFALGAGGLSISFSVRAYGTRRRFFRLQADRPQG
jgi:hypothetical protein